MASALEHHSPFSSTAFEGRTVVVAGGANGIGQSIARRLSDHGCAVAILDKDVGAALTLCESIGLAGGLAWAFEVDIVDRESVDRAVAKVAEVTASIDFLVNSAGVVIGGALDRIDPADWRRSFAVNVDGALFLSQALKPHLARSDAPAIVHIASLAGRLAYPGGGGYGPSKAALISLSHQLAVEWAPLGIRVNVLTPGTTLTPLVQRVHSPESIADRARATPLGRLVEPDEVALAACFLLSSAASAITAQFLDVDCGMSQALVRPAH